MPGKPPPHPPSKTNVTRKSKIKTNGILGAMETIIKFKRNKENTFVGKIQKGNGSFKTIILSSKEAIDTLTEAFDNNTPVSFKVIQTNKTTVVKSYRITEEAARQFLELV